MSDNIRVCCRFRPFNQMEKDNGSKNVITITEDRTVKVNVANTARAHGKSDFSFDHAFPPDAGQDVVFEHTASHLAHDVMKGFNCTIFAYGQTGSGKTHTMMGVPNTDHEGIIPRLTERIFEEIEMADENLEFTVKISYVEIYMEQITDLLNPTPAGENLRIREGSRGGVWIQDVTETYVSGVDEVLEIMAAGSEQRHVASTKMNDFSSRSHSVFILTVGQRDKNTGSKKGAKLILVDLAGSETVKKTGASGSTLKEAQHINRSLSALGNVINALTSGASHVPYRDSKLTRLLSDSLGGNSKTCLVVTCSPSSFNVEETLSTLRFGTRAKKIKNKPIINQEKSVAEYKALLAAAVNKCAEQEEIIQQLNDEVSSLRQQLLSGAKLSASDIADLQAKEQLVVQSGSIPRDNSPRLNPEPSSEMKEQMVERRSSTMMKALELQGQLQLLEQQSQEKEMALSSIQEEIAEKDQVIEELQEEMAEKDESLNRLQKQLLDGQFAAHTSNDSEEASLRDKINVLKSEQELYMQKIDQLQKDNLELAKLNSVHQSSVNVVSGVSESAANLPPAPAHLNADQKAVYEQAREDLMKKMGQGAQAKSSPDQQFAKLKENYDVLMAALGRKCEQYVEMQMKYQKASDKVMAMKRAEEAKADSEVAPSRRSSDAAMTRKVTELEKRLKASDQLCQKLYQSGLYWQKRGQRKETELRAMINRVEQLQKRERKMHEQFEVLKNGGKIEAPGHLRHLSGSRSASGRTRALSRANLTVPSFIQGGGKNKQPGQHSHKPDLKRLDSIDAFF